MILSRRTLFKAAAVAAAGLALPQTELITDAKEVARHYWALDKTHLGAVSAPVPYDPDWWRIGEVVGEDGNTSTLRFDEHMFLPTTLRAGDTIQMGGLAMTGFYHSALPREQYLVREVDHEHGIITVLDPGRNTFRTRIDYGK